MINTNESFSPEAASHSVVFNDRLYVRNSQKSAAYQLPLANVGKSPKP
jgi:hypothetical protein